jgi:cellulose synthase/poly-beta-1,6-N-acetylglucosamine synthase-like glycosyltransferase
MSLLGRLPKLALPRIIRDRHVMAIQVFSFFATVMFFYALYLFLYPNLKLTPLPTTPTGTTSTTVTTTTTLTTVISSTSVTSVQITTITTVITSSTKAILLPLAAYFPPWLAFGINTYANYAINFYSSPYGIALFYVILLSVTFLNEVSYIPLAFYHVSVDRQREAELEYKFYPRVTIIVPAHNEEEVIETTVRTLREADYPNLEIIVVNDGSTDNTAGVVQPFSRAGWVRLINRETLGGKSGAINTGVAAAHGDIILVIDADVALERDALRRLILHFMVKDVYAASGNVKVGNRVNILTKLQALEYIKDLNIRRRALDLLHSVLVIPGACGAYRKDAFSKVGSMDRDTVVEDMDITIKLLKSGQDIRYEPHALAFTEAPQTVKAWFRQRKRWYGGAFQAFNKHRPGWYKFGSISFFGFPSLFLSMFLTPLLELVTMTLLFLYLYEGLFYGVLLATTVILLIELFTDIAAIYIDKEDWRLLFYAPLFVFFYRNYVDVTRMYAYFLAITGRLGWYRTGRYGGLSGKISA